MKKNRIGITIFLTALFSCIIAGLAGFAIGYVIDVLSPEEQKLVDEYRLLKEEWLYGNEEKYIDELAAKGLVYYVANDSHDSYTFYTSTESEQGLSTDGTGFGYESHYYDGGLYLVNVYNDSSSYRAGMKTGDVLFSVKVDDETFDFKSHSLSEISSFFSSHTGKDTQFTFTGKRGDEEKTFMLKRDKYTQDYIDIIEEPSSTNGYQATIKINTFLGSPSIALKTTLSLYSRIDKLVLDLRGNGGGYVSQAEEMAKLFVKKGTLIYQLRDKNDKVTEESYQKNNPTFNIPEYKIIMDNNSASASEIFILAMRAGANATTYGLKSYGKGIAQSFKTFTDGSVVRYTCAYVYGPEKENETMYDEGNDDDSIMCIHGKGIIPDITYEKDYSFLGSSLDLSSIGISENGQNYFLRVLNELYTGYPTSYDADTHYTDVIKKYSVAMKIKYMDRTITAFNSKGGMGKELNDILNKEEYDKYLYYYDDLTSSVMER